MAASAGPVGRRPSVPLGWCHRNICQRPMACNSSLAEQVAGQVSTECCTALPRKVSGNLVSLIHQTADAQFTRFHGTYNCFGKKERTARSLILCDIDSGPESAFLAAKCRMGKKKQRLRPSNVSRRSQISDQVRGAF